MRSRLAAAAISLTLLAVAACDKGTPTAPAGTKLAVTASPLVIPPNGTATVTITALRSTGQPVNPGTEIRLDTTLGTIDPIVTTDERGQALATLHGTGVGGEATITARSGTADPATVKVNIGAKADKVTIIPTPASIPGDESAQVSLVAIVRDTGGRPVEGANVNLTTSAGRLNSQGATLITNAQGEVRDTLSASADAVANAGAAIHVTAQAASGGASVTGTVDITIRGT